MIPGRRPPARHGSVRDARRYHGGVELPDELLRPALELAWMIAVIGSQQRPPTPAPPPLRPLLRFQKLPGKALGTVRRVVEDDEEFRTRVTTVADVATEEFIGRPSWLWLQRPEGWEEELAALAAAEPVSGGPRAKGRSRDDGLDRAVAGRLDRAEARVREQTAELEVLRAQVRKASGAHEQVESELAKVKARADELERANARLRARVERGGAELDEAREAATAGRQEADALRVELQEAERKLAELDGGTGARAPSELVEHPAPGAPASLVANEDEVRPLVPRSALDALDSAAAAARHLSAALGDLASSLSPGSPATAPGSEAPMDDTTGSGAATVVAGVRRRALRIPRGMHAGSRQADSWLLTAADARLIVDGYNVAKLGWPDQQLEDQRERLVDVLEDLAVRHKTPVEVVFDGADVGAVRPSRRRHVRVRFSPAGVLADDVIRELVAQQPAASPIVVVTDDREVVDDVRALGANVVTSAGLLAVARR